MSYMNQGNMYGSKPDYDPNYMSYNKKVIQPIEDSIEPSCCKNEKPVAAESCKVPDEPSCNVSKGCSCSCNCNSGTTECDFNCSPENKCCNGQNIKFDPAKAKTVCTYLQTLFDEKDTCGSTLFIPINTSTVPLVTSTTQLAPICNNTPCALSTSSIFTVESIKTKIMNFSYLFTTLPTTSVLIDGKPVLSLNPYNNGFTATLDPTILDETCLKNNLGTKASVLLNGLASWQFLAIYEICGKVTTAGTTCKFYTTIKNLITSPIVSQLPSTFVVSEICVPLNATLSAPVLNATFKATGQLINPVLTPVVDPANPSSIKVNLAGSLMLTPTVNLQTLQYNKVCFPAMI